MRRLLTNLNWKVFRALLAAGLLRVVAVLPMPLVLILALVQDGILPAGAVLIGLILNWIAGIVFGYLHWRL